MQELYYATGNKDKFETVARYVAEYAPHLTLKSCTKDFTEIQSHDQRAIALDKARQAWEYLQKPVLVDDAGIYFEKYPNFPGFMTKYVYHSLGFDGLCKLTKPGDKATFRLHMVYWYGPQNYEVFMGECHGHIDHQTAYEATPDSPYNKIFVPEDAHKTLAQMICEEGKLKKYDYRISALQQFLEWHATR